jgi:hypothetical protein
LSLTLIAVICCSQSRADHSEQLDEGRSIFNAVLLNLQAIQQYDLTLRIEYHWSCEEDTALEKLVNVRMLFDQVNERYLIVERMTDHAFVPLAGSINQQRSDLLHAAMSVNKITTVKHKANAIQRLNDMNVGFAFFRFAPNVHNQGIAKFPAGFEPNLEDVRSVEQRRLFSQIIHSFHDDEHCSIVIQDTERSKRFITMDRNALTLKMVKNVLTKSDGQELVTWSEKYQHESHHGIQLPTRVDCERLESREFLKKKMQGTTTLFAELRWQNINEALDENYFDLAILSDDNALLRLTQWEPVEKTETSRKD